MNDYINDERSNLSHILKPCTFGVDLPETGSRNMASNIDQANESAGDSMI